MNARDIVSLLLEADQPAGGNRQGVYIFGPHLPNEGYSVPDLEQAVADFRHFGLIRQGAENSSQLLDWMVKQGYTFFFKKGPNEVEVIGKVPAETTPNGQKRAAQYLSLDRKEKVQYRATPTSTPTEMNVDYALFGSKELERDQREQEKTAQEQQREQEKTAQQKQAEQEKLAKAKRSVPTQQLGNIDPEEEGWKDPPTGVGYSAKDEFSQLDAPLEVGFVYKDTNKGLRVMEVVPGGSAAQAGLQAGDFIVQVREFKPKNSDELVGPYYVYNEKHLRYVLRNADPDHLIPFRVYRGDLPVNVPIKAEPKKQPQPQSAHPGAEIHIPGEEARQFFKRPTRSKRTGPYQRTFTKKLMRPNDRTPASETGNQPPNVSALT